MIGEFATNSLQKFCVMEIDFIIAMVHCHLLYNYILSKLFLMHSDWLECSVKYFAAKK